MTPRPWTAGGRCAVLGAGVVGTACAIELAQAGFSVELIDRDEPGSATSAGNAGIMLASHIEPMNDWKLLRSLPILLMKRDGELILRKDYLKELKPWLVGYAKALSPARMEQSMLALASLNRLAGDAWEDLVARAGIADKFHRTGAIVAYSSSHAWRDRASVWEKRKREFGIKWQLLDARELDDYVPAISANLHVGVLVPSDGLFTDPKGVVSGLAAHAAASGVAVVRDVVKSVGHSTTGMGRVTLAQGGERDYDGVVIALGAWSGPVAAALGDAVPLDVQRGYNFTYPDPGVKVRIPTIIEDRGLAVSPLRDGLRFGGWSEFGGLQLPPSPKVFRRLAKVAKELVQGLNPAGASEWMGHRPCLPDSVPVIGPGSKGGTILYAFGHGHLGLTEAAVTARCVAALAAGEQAPVQIEMFSPARFAS